jgi:thioesterase domain-containing protein
VSRGFDGRETPLDRVEAIAADHLNAIRAFQPTGPYRLIGACFGGRVAYEMARQLVGAGERVDFLCLLDPSPPFTNSRGLPRLPVRIGSSRSQLARFVTRRLRLYAAEFMDLNWRQRAAFVSAKLAVMREIILRRDPFRGDRSEVHAVALHEANQVAGRRYVPEPYDGPVILALTEGRVVSAVRNYRLDWLELMPHCGPLQYVPGRDTGDMLIPPNVQVLADRVNAWLLDASTPAVAESSYIGLSAAA